MSTRTPEPEGLGLSAEQLAEKTRAMDEPARAGSGFSTAQDNSNPLAGDAQRQGRKHQIGQSPEMVEQDGKDGREENGRKRAERSDKGKERGPSALIDLPGVRYDLAHSAGRYAYRQRIQDRMNAGDKEEVQGGIDALLAIVDRLLRKNGVTH
jgi:hypothetical protein